MRVGKPTLHPYQLPALPTLERSPEALQLRREVQARSHSLEEIRAEKHGLIARLDADLSHDEREALYARVFALSDREKALQGEMIVLRAEEQTLLQPSQPMISDWQAEYDRLLKTVYLPALEHFVAAWGELYAFTLKALAQKITLRLCHGPHTLVNNWVGQLKQFLKEPRA